jgi:hypothetical protein
MCACAVRASGSAASQQRRAARRVLVLCRQLAQHAHPVLLRMRHARSGHAREQRV